MKRGSTFFLKAVLIVISLVTIGVSSFMLIAIEPAKAGDYYPIAIGIVVSSIPFLIALYQAFQLLNLIDKNNAFSEASIIALKKIKYCALSISALYSIGMPYIFVVAELDDAPGVIAMSLIVIAASFVISIFSAVLYKLVENAIQIKSENDLTV